tara:strand:+ start:754 stop:1347 length:594 start_codon:yes stop_codon:yes gene_type:complete
MIKLKQLLAETAYSGSVPPQSTPVVSTTDLRKLETQLAAAEAVTQGLQSQIDGVTADREIIAAQKLAADTELLITSFETKIKEQCLNLKRFKPSLQKDLCKQYYESLSSLNTQLLNLKAGIVPDSGDGDEGDIEGPSTRRSSSRQKKLTPEARTTMWVSIAASILGLLQTIKLIFPGKDKTPGTGTIDQVADDGELG